MQEVYMTGAIASPRHKLAAATPHAAADYPVEYARIPSNPLQMWGNSSYGTCVSAEEAFAKLDDGIVVTDANLIAWARSHGYLNGAALTDVMDTMQTTGLPSVNQVYVDGPYHSVDWTNQDVLSSALYQGVVKIGVASRQLPQSETGWHLTSAKKDRNIDHCVALCGYGTAAFLYKALGQAVPSGIDPTQFGYLLFTWKSIGFITQSALNAICGEAWLRVPTTPGVTPQPTPTPTPTPLPPPPTPVPLPDPTPAPIPINWAALIQFILELLKGFQK